MKKVGLKETARLYWKLGKSYKWLVLGTLVGLLIAVAAQMVAIIALRDFFDVLATETGSDVMPMALQKLAIYAGWEILAWAAWRINTFAVIRYQSLTVRDIYDYCFEYVHHHSYAFFEDNFVGSLVKKVNRFVRSFERIADLILYNFLSLFYRMFIILGVLLWVNQWLGLVVFVWIIVFMSLNVFLSLKKLKYDRAKAHADSKISGQLADTFTNNQNVKLFVGFKKERRAFQNLTRSWYKKTRKAWDFDHYVEMGQSAFMIVLEVGILYVALELWQLSFIEVADFVLIQLYMFEIFHQVWPFGRNVRDFYESFADAEEMAEILLESHEVKDKKGAKSFKILSGRVDFRNVSFTYSEADDHVINNFDLTIKSGQKVALIGPSGGGKTTITKLLLRFYDIQKGKILVDDQNVADVTQESLRGAMALVPQDPILFHRSLMENIRYGRTNASDEEVIAAAKMAFCHDFIQQFPKGYKTFVGERGVKLSGGQRQRVAIARAILSNAKILILDEATSSLDSESEMLIQKALDNLVKNKTTIVIAHRLSTVMSADRILVLQNGKIVEDGRHSDLINKKGSMYGKMWDLQVGGYMQD
ncbi:MAG: ABC transporter ATP-binding protein [Candidatus Gracilibacteria bacterium]